MHFMIKTKYLIWVLGALLLINSCDTRNHQEKPSVTPATKMIENKKSFQAISLLGDTLFSPEFSAGQQPPYDSALYIAEQKYRKAPHDLKHIIGLGRRLAGLYQYQEAIQIYSEGIQKFPEAPELYRHRGQCFIAVRDFDKAIKDLEKSVILVQNMPITLEPDGLQVSSREASSLQFYIWYHLGLAYYLSGQYGKAAQSYEKCLTYCVHDHELAATSDWLYMTYRRLGEDEVAEKTLDLIREDMTLHQEEGYFERLLMYKGLIEPDTLLQRSANAPFDKHHVATQVRKYGVGNYYLSEGDSSRGQKILNEIVDGRYWAAYEYIAAEADLARIKNEK